MKRTGTVVLASVLGLVAGVALGGWWFGRHEASDNRPLNSTVRSSTAVPVSPLAGGAAVGGSAGAEVSHRRAAIWTKPVGPDRAAELRLALRDSAPEELERWARSLAGGPPSRSRDADRQLVLELWARRSPAEALAHAEAERDPRVRSLLLAAAVTGAMTTKPTDVLAKVARDSRDEVVQAAFDCLGQMDASLAIGLIGGLSDAPPAFRQRAHWAVLETVIGGGDYDRARELVRVVGDPTLQSRLTASLADAWGRADPQRAAEWAAAPWADESGRAQTLANIGATWAAREPRVATEFAARLEPGAARERMLTETVLHWATADLVAASDWINRLDASPQNDPAVAAIATDPRLMNYNPAVALSWAESIASPEKRLGALGAILQTWQQRDAAAAQRYLAEAPALKAEERTTLRAALQALVRE